MELNKVYFSNILNKNNKLLINYKCGLNGIKKCIRKRTNYLLNKCISNNYKLELTLKAILKSKIFVNILFKF